MNTPTLCKNYDDIISEVPDKQFKDIQNFMSVPEYAVVHKGQLENAIKARNAKELSQQLNDVLPVNNIKVKKAKI